MKWIKQGLIFKPDGKLSWAITHATAPVAENITDDLFRVYFSGRDKKNRSRIGYIEININSPKDILYTSKKSVLSLGSVGSFDESGTMTSWITQNDNKNYLYYTGWTRGVTVPYYFYIGLATSQNGKDFQRFSKAPVLGRNIYDPYLTASPCVIKENATWKMWYVSSIKRELRNKDLLPYYRINYTESEDGITWDKERQICIDFKSIDEYAISRPCVLKENGTYKMWYSYCSYKQNYRIGYAESIDGKTWLRKDDCVGIDISTPGWDSEMVEYPFVFEHKGKKYMLYNGNNFGKSGFGYAILEDE